jgi:hypothetical protein
MHGLRGSPLAEAARTIAVIAGVDAITTTHLVEVLQYRPRRTKMRVVHACSKVTWTMALGCHETTKRTFV